MKSARSTLLLLVAALALGACESRQALGTVKSVIVIADSALWAEVGDSLMDTLEPRVFTTHSERTFNVTHVVPGDAEWDQFRRFRQVLVIGNANDLWMQPVIKKAGGALGAGVHQVHNVWSLNQIVTAIVADNAEQALRSAPRVAAAIDSAFRSYTIQRMYTTGPDSALLDTLRTQHGFGLLLPRVYAPLPRPAGVLMYQNNTQASGDLVRSILITWRDGVLEPSADATIQWRDSVANEQYRPPQTTARENLLTRPTSAHGVNGYEVQGVWSGTDPGWPASGIFIARLLPCPARNRTFLVDTWLYAPDPRRNKYEYLIQLQTILDTFTCA